MIQLMDTTLRDGEQTQGVAFSPAEKLGIARALLHSLNVDRIEIASARVSQGERIAVETILDWASQHNYLDRIEVLGFVDHQRSVDWIVQSGGRVLNLLTKGSEKHCRAQLKQSPDAHLTGIVSSVHYARERGLSVNLYLEDWSNGYVDSPEYVYSMVEALTHLDINRVMLPDTLGVMTPDQVFESIKDMCNRYPSLKFDFHAHNDYGLATANVLKSVEAGATGIHTTMNCLGERAGNVSLAEVTVVLRDKLNKHIGINESKIHNVSQLVAHFSGKHTAANAPIIGTDVFTQTSGLHADGDRKAGLYQTALRPERFARRHSYALGKMSGRASLAKNLEALDFELSTDDQEKVLQRIVEIGDAKTTVTADDLPFIIADVLESGEYQHVDLLNCQITSGLEVESTVSLRLCVDGEMYRATGSGNGGLDAFINAVAQIFEPIGVTIPRLTDFEIHIPRGGQTNALTECLITWDQAGKTLRTRGVHANQVFAAINAALRMLNLVLHVKKPLPAETSSDGPHQATDQLRSHVTYPTGVATNS